MRSAALLAVPFALVLAACGGSDSISPDLPPGPTGASGAADACSLLTSGQVTANLAVGGTPAPAPTPSDTPSGQRELATVTTKVGSAARQLKADQCRYATSGGPGLVVTVIPRQSGFQGQVSQLSDYTRGATVISLGGTPAYVQNAPAAAALAFENHGQAVILAIDSAESASGPPRTRRLEQLAASILGVSIGQEALATQPPSTSSAAPPTPAGAPGTQTSGQTAAAKVMQTDQLKFDPATSTVKSGSIVEWDNGSAVPHNVTFDQYPDITSSTMNKGDTYQVKFTTAGTFQYHCTFHPGMDGTITVTG